ncbi:conserved domain protein [Prevotella sp. CAG:1092]|nr:conserved domain protein [Prevotella sp. CAG:1092]
MAIITDSALSVFRRSENAKEGSACIFNKARTKAPPSNSNTNETVVDVGIPRLLNMSSTITSVTITAKNTIITSWKEKWDGNIIPCLVTSIIPDDMVAPRSTPNDATINTTLKVATLAPIADCKKFTASLLTPTKRSKTAKQSRKTTISK